MTVKQTVKIGVGDKSIVCDKDDYENGFPLNPKLKKLVESLESKPKPKAKAKPKAK